MLVVIWLEACVSVVLSVCGLERVLVVIWPEICMSVVCYAVRV